MVDRKRPLRVVNLVNKCKYGQAYSHAKHGDPESMSDSGLSIIYTLQEQYRKHCNVRKRYNVIELASRPIHGRVTAKEDLRLHIWFTMALVLCFYR